jgi:hypothetical protein
LDFFGNAAAIGLVAPANDKPCRAPFGELTSDCFAKTL